MGRESEWKRHETLKDDGDVLDQDSNSSTEEYSSSSSDEYDRKSHKKKNKKKKKVTHSKSSRKRYSDSDSESSESGSESSESESERRRRKRRERKRREERRLKREKGKKKRNRDDDDDDRERRRKKSKKKKKEKDDKKKNRKGKIGAVTSSWGKYGTIQEADMWNKRPEFTAWLAEVKQVNLESIPNRDEKIMFKEYMEDYNTATFPSKKYYNVDAYYRRKSEKQMKKGFKKVTKTERIVFNDEEQRRQELQQAREKQKEQEVKVLKDSMKSGLAQAMKEQVRLKEEMVYQFKIGNNEAAIAIQKKLEPDVI